MVSITSICVTTYKRVSLHMNIIVLSFLGPLFIYFLECFASSTSLSSKFDAPLTSIHTYPCKYIHSHFDLAAFVVIINTSSNIVFCLRSHLSFWVFHILHVHQQHHQALHYTPLTSINTSVFIVFARNLWALALLLQLSRASKDQGKQ